MQPDQNRRQGATSSFFSHCIFLFVFRFVTNEPFFKLFICFFIIINSNNSISSVSSDSSSSSIFFRESLYLAEFFAGFFETQPNLEVM